jgi:hypothetical protein
MRTTLTLDDDLADKLADMAKQTDQPFKVVVNQAIRRGIDNESVSAGRFHYKPHAGNLLPGIDDRRLNEMAWEPEEERFRG